jgi:cytochrome c-type biogenesis protein
MTDSLTFAQMGLSVAAGGLTTLSPCVFPLIPLVVGGAIQSNRYAPVAMGLGMALSFAFIGLILGAAGASIGLDVDLIRQAGGYVLIALGIVMLVPALNHRMMLLLTPLSNRASVLAGEIKGTSLWSAVGLGALLGLVWSPCSGPLLASALTLAASDGGAPEGAFVLGLFGIGAAIPLVLVAYATKAGFDRAKVHVLTAIEKFKKFFGIIIALTGVAIITGWDKRLEAMLVRALPDWWLSLTVAI